MADFGDEGQAVSELWLELAREKRAPEGPHPTGHCFSCGEPLEPPLRWCNAECRDDWEAEYGSQ